MDRISNILNEELPGYYNNYAHRIYHRIIAMSGYKCAQDAYKVLDL